MFHWLTDVVAAGGYLGIAFLMFAENVFPPIPSELIMPLAGFSAARGELNPVWVVIAGTGGSLAGVYVWYALGRWIGLERLKRWSVRHGRWLTLTPGDLDRAGAWFRRHGGIAVFFGRLLPAIRTLISVPAGVSRYPRVPFVIFSLLGTALWTTFLTGCGYVLESQYARVAAYLDPVSTTVVVALLAIYVYRVVRFSPRPAQN